jgi:hypothetical protein
MSIQIIISLPAVVDPSEVEKQFNGYYDESDLWIEGAGYQTEIPPSGVMPASNNNGGKHLVHCVIGATYDEIVEVLEAQLPLWQDFGSQDILPTTNPDYDPDDPESPPTITVVYSPLNNSVWNFLPDIIDYDDEGNPIGSHPQTMLHHFVGCTQFPEKGA